MIADHTAALLRIVGLLGLALSVVLWGVAEYSENRRTLVSLSAAAAGGAVLAYLIGVWATASSGARGVMPAFP